MYAIFFPHFSYNSSHYLQYDSNCFVGLMYKALQKYVWFHVQKQLSNLTCRAIKHQKSNSLSSEGWVAGALFTA